MSVIALTAMRFGALWWLLKQCFVNGVLTGARVYFALFVVDVTTYHKQWFLEHIFWIAAIGTVCGCLDLIDGKAADWLGVESPFGRILDPLADGAFFLSIGFAVVALQDFTPQAVLQHGIPAILLGVYGGIVETMRLCGMIKRSSLIAKANVGVLGLAAISFFAGVTFGFETIPLATYWLHLSVCFSTVALRDYWLTYKESQSRTAEFELMVA